MAAEPLSETSSFFLYRWWTKS